MRKLVLAFFVILVGCSPWKQAGGVYKSSSDGFSVSLPEKWMLCKKGASLTVTRDGPALQCIYIVAWEAGKDMPNTKKKLAKEMLPQELAEVVVDDLACNKEVLNLEVTGNTPVTVDGRPGFRLNYGYKTKAGLRYDAVLYGVLVENKVYCISYTAPRRHYFDKDIETFETVVGSLKMLR